MTTSNDSQTAARQRLQNALRIGRQGLALQLRCLLMVCQSVRARPLSVEPAAPLQIDEARLQALAHIAPHLSAGQRHSLYALVAGVEDSSMRLSLLARAIRSVPIDEALPHARAIWQALDTLESPAQRACALIDIADFIHDTAGSTLAASTLLRLIHTAQNMKSTEAKLRALMGLVPRCQRLKAATSYTAFWPNCRARAATPSQRVRFTPLRPPSSRSMCPQPSRCAVLSKRRPSARVL
jgi:hypothetical protein